jgi:hypothetical protein
MANIVSVNFFTSYVKYFMHLVIQK